MVKNARNPKILHLATRGFFLTEEEEAPTLLRRYENPLLRSGLVFAGANHADEVTYGDDGVLTALEISGMALHGTYLVALTACETDIGETRTEEGVYGLRRSFALAGAKNLLISLWPASDKSAINQITTFYKHLANMPPVKALRRAQLDAISYLKKIYNGAAPPVLWAPFMLQGAGALQN